MTNYAKITLCYLGVLGVLAVQVAFGLRSKVALDQIQAVIPHREPFLLLDEIVEQTDDRIVCRKTFMGDEVWYLGQYTNYPTTPVLVI